MIKRYYERDPRPERLAKVPEQYLNMYTTKAMITLNCMVQHMQPIEEAMEKRIRSIPRGWWRWRVIRKFAQVLLDDLLYTIPEGKFDGLANELNRTRVEYRQGPAATIKQATDIVMDTPDAISLAYYSHEYCCKQVCTKETCTGCPLAHALDACLTIDRGARMWNTVDIVRDYEKIAEGKK